MSEAEVQDLHKRIRIEWLDSLNANEYDSLSRSRALDSLSLFCAKHEVNSIRIAREEAQAKRLPINWRSNKEVIALVRMQVKDAREEGFNSKFEVMALYTKAKKEVEVRVREEMINKFKSFLKKHEVMFFGCDCSDCQTMENMTMKEKFKEKYFSCFIQDCKNKPFGFFGVGKTKGLIEDGKILICYCKKHKKEAEKLAETEKKRLNTV